MSIAELRRRADSGEAEARLALGARLITADGVDPDAAEGARLVEQACAQGSAEASALLATIEAMGVARPQNWERAFDHLQLAAERGLDSARDQLVLLARAPEPALGTAGASSDIWKRLRERIDISALIVAPPKQSLSDSPRIRIVEGFATPAECDWAMARARGSLTRAKVLDQETGEEKSHPDRTNKAIEFRLTGMDVVMQVLRARIGATTNLPVPVFEPVQIMHYSVGEEFRPHFDFLTEENEGWAAQMRRFGQRIATFLLFLNEDFEGGETEFPRAGISHRGGKGDALFWANVDPSGAPDRLTFHAGKPPTRGEKWILSQWIRDRSPAAE
ncbi:MAG TPA: 2OG-Fe(II) oxygenase [Allosphingosinicella sp.]